MSETDRPEPYVPVKVAPYRFYPDSYTEVYYYTYMQPHRQVTLIDNGKDELDTYLQAVKELNRLKKRADKRREKKEQSG